MYHFAYGSNMNIAELKKYCCNKNITIVGPGYLDNYIFRYRLIKGKLPIKAKANIEPRKGSKVYGLIINIDGSLDKLHKKEGVLDFIYEINKNFKIHSISDKKIYNCFSYVMKNDIKLEQGRPSYCYYKKILDGCNSFNFPKSYLKRINYFSQ